MTLLNQKTIKKTTSFSGIGLHSGKLTNINISPSAPNSGIVFKRIDYNQSIDFFNSCSNRNLFCKKS